MKQRARDPEVCQGCRCSLNGVHQPCLGIRAKRHFHVEIPLIVFVRLVHLGIVLTRVVRRSAGCGNDRDIDDRALDEHQTLPHEKPVHGAEGAHGEPVLFQQVAEMQDRGVVRYCTSREREVGEAPHRGDPVKRLLHGGFQQRIPQLHQENKQHRAKRVRMLTFPRKLVERTDRYLQRRAANSLINLFEQHLTPHFLATGILLGV
jgi:hypothetical protein